MGLAFCEHFYETVASKIKTVLQKDIEAEVEGDQTVAFRVMLRKNLPGKARAIQVMHTDQAQPINSI